MSAKQCIFKLNKPNQQEESLISPCFQISKNVELKEIPTTGEEYLLKVMNERRNHATITRCNVDCSKFSRNQSRFVTQVPHVKAPDNLKPTIEWQNVQVADFSESRMYISRLLAKKTQWPKDVTNISLDQNSSKEWIELFETREPTLSCILGLNHTILDNGLEILIESLNNVKPGDTIPYKTGQWIYAILACTRQPLLSDTVSILRNLARKCSEIRSRLNPEKDTSKEYATPLNVFICLVARYFRQYDLAD
ncbi:gem-associated protein 2-like [Zerene cesonia]|uniref:gem-associated protein 2-like n=1 Tax=Zerene cesonia TaxID=33412 RepID=UPI0018E56875|nr:gem-associated protein 2-like [Zerene cesonia]